MYPSATYDFVFSSGQIFRITVSQLNDRADLFSLTYSSSTSNAVEDDAASQQQVVLRFDDAGTALRHGHREAQVMANDAGESLTRVNCHDESLIQIEDIEKATGLPCSTSSSS